VILGIVFFISLLGFVQEYKAERAMEALQEMVAPEANVVRAGKMSRIPVRGLVPGDVVYLDTIDHGQVPTGSHALAPTGQMHRQSPNFRINLYAIMREYSGHRQTRRRQRWDV